MRAIEGYYDGVNIVTDDNIFLAKGQRVVIYIPDKKAATERSKIDFSRYVGKGGRMLNMDAQEYVNGLRDHDRVS